MDLGSHFRQKSVSLFLSFVIVATALWLPGDAEATVEKSPNDKRQYESFVLPNKLKVLIVSDPDADKAAAAMDVFVGSGRDPKGREGLAHFLEHMLFLGTEKYPQAGDYQSFISEHGGSHNAYTSFEHTKYFFDIGKDHLAPALDRFAQFFVAPLFNPEYVAREKNAVHSEYRLKRKDEARRVLDARKQTINTQHPFSNFAVGSLDTLADRENSSLRDELIQFYHRHYSANLMALVVLGKEPIPVLKQWIIEHFSPIINTNAGPLEISEPLYTEEQFPARLDIVPLEDRQTMALTFSMPPVAEHYRSKPIHYIANLLGHEGAGSLLSLLKRKGWSQGLYAGAGLRQRNESTFRVSIELTEDGLGHITDIASHVFQYLRLIQREGIALWRFEEQQKLNELSFRFRERSSPIGYVKSLAYNLQIYPPMDMLRGPYAMDVYAPALIRRFLDQLTPDNVLITVTAKGLESDAISPWYDTPYRLTGLDESIRQRWRHEEIDAELVLPQRNVFLPNELSIKPLINATAKPVLLKNGQGFEFWFQQDGAYQVPRADFYFSVRSETAYDSPEHSILTKLYVQLVNDQLDEFSYPVRLAGLSYNLYTHTRGFSVRISGYNDKQDLLLARIVEALHNPTTDTKRFAFIKERLIRSLVNGKRKKPYTQTMSEVTSLLLKPYWTDEKLIAAIQPLTVEDLRQFVSKLLEKVYVVALSHGNLYQEQAVELTTLLEEKFLENATPVTVSGGQVIKLTTGDFFTRQLEVDHPDSAITVYFQGSDSSYASRAKFSLLKQLIAAPFYQELRTERQLGYVVFSVLMPLLDAPGIGFVVQSPNTDPLGLESHVERFITDYGNAVAVMTEEQFARHKEALLTRILTVDDSLRERSNRYWKDLNRGNYEFDSREQIAAVVRRITKDDFEKFYKGFLVQKNRKRLVIRCIGSEHRQIFANRQQEKKDILIVNPHAFIKNKEYFSGLDNLILGRKAKASG